jgi:hypothetical protein
VVGAAISCQTDEVGALETGAADEAAVEPVLFVPLPQETSATAPNKQTALRDKIFFIVYFSLI